MAAEDRVGDIQPVGLTLVNEVIAFRIDGLFLAKRVLAGIGFEPEGAGLRFEPKCPTWLR